MILKCFFAGIYLWFCATVSIIFYGVDRKEDDESWGWIEVTFVSTTLTSCFQRRAGGELSTSGSQNSPSKC